MTEIFKAEASKEWDQARRKALLSQLNSLIRQKDVRLRDFEDISRQLHLRTPRYKGIQDVPLDKIVGSVGRYQDFIQSFLPVTAKMEERWEHIAEMYLNPLSPGLPPIEVYKVGDSYFVKDGNHRVSVARQLDMPAIEAHVWEYALPTSMTDDADIDTLLMEAEKNDFFHITRLDIIRPDNLIEVTLPSGYRELLHQVMEYKNILEEIDQEPKTIEEAAALWHDMCFEPSIQVIQREAIMELFPGRTCADLYIWTHMEQERLERRYGHNIRISQAIKRVNFKHQNVLQRLWQFFKNLLPQKN